MDVLPVRLPAEWLEQLSGRRCISFVDPWKPSRQARGVVTYPLQRAPLDVSPFALFGLDHNWARDSPADRRLVRLLNGTVRLKHGKGGATPNSN